MFTICEVHLIKTFTTFIFIINKTIGKRLKREVAESVPGNKDIATQKTLFKN
jgi:hypothetical protein